ncbi:carbohydrate ABC transporter permease [Anaerocolumna sp. MB42-C2]|uniref:carbohydrate ABC transporter permease n=1 Tax=Anaerocolumna sp. MB42-C2 TaxID=3070997 RepID=UPI0027E1FC13|nr:carbohydrate ABC transporter permease [Anaerocolumna sp. MB42-C2]WMJ85609.1 carbohydrate ABC transporter permease [Anaerocolumna sp. MB42-C2]
MKSQNIVNKNINIRMNGQTGNIKAVKQVITESNMVTAFSYLFIGVLVLIVLFPMMHVVSKAFSAEWAINSGSVGILPVGFQTFALNSILKSRNFLIAFGNSLFITLIGTLCTLTLSALTAYPLSMRNLPYMKGFLLLFVFTMYFGGGIIPTYLLYNTYGILNTKSVLILPGLINVFHLLIIKNFYEDIPESIIESAKVDGANNLTIFLKFIVPLSKPVYATIVVFTSVMLWNNYFDPMMYINSPDLQTLPLYLRDMIMKAQDVQAKELLLVDVSAESITAAAIVASTIPILLVYPFMQRHFVKGMTIGSTKG